METTRADSAPAAARHRAVGRRGQGGRRRPARPPCRHHQRVRQRYGRHAAAGHRRGQPGSRPSAASTPPRSATRSPTRAANKVEPPCRAPIEIEEFERARGRAARRPRAGSRREAVLRQALGRHYGGSFIRGGDGDRRLTHYEVTQMLVQPHPAGATTENRSPARRSSRPRRRTRRGPISPDPRGQPGHSAALADERLLVRLGVLGRDADGVTAGRRSAACSRWESIRRSSSHSSSSRSSCCHRPRMGEIVTGRSPLPRQRDHHAARSRRSSPTPSRWRSATCASARSSPGAGREDRYDYPLDVIRELVDERAHAPRLQPGRAR